MTVIIHNSEPLDTSSSVYVVKNAELAEAAEKEDGSSTLQGVNEFKLCSISTSSSVSKVYSLEEASVVTSLKSSSL